MVCQICGEGGTFEEISSKIFKSIPGRISEGVFVKIFYGVYLDLLNKSMEIFFEGISVFLKDLLKAFLQESVEDFSIRIFGGLLKETHGSFSRWLFEEISEESSNEDFQENFRGNF